MQVVDQWQRQQHGGDPPTLTFPILLGQSNQCATGTRKKLWQHPLIQIYSRIIVSEAFWKIISFPIFAWSLCNKDLKEILEQTLFGEFAMFNILCAISP